MSILTCAGARPRRIDDKPLPGLVFQCAQSLWGLASVLSDQPDWGIACFKNYPNLLEAILTDYADGSNAQLFARDAELVLFPGFQATPAFFSKLETVLADAYQITAISEWQPQPVTLAQLFATG